MHTFFNLSPKQTKGLDKSIYENSQKLYHDAKILADRNNSFSTATSLLILSLEETIKAIIIKLHSEGLKVYKIDGIKKFVSTHIIRHQLAQFIETGAGLLDVYNDWEESKKRPPKFKKQWLNNIFNGLGAMSKFSTSYKNIQKLQGFNDLKNQGLYSEYKDGLKLPKEIITEKDFNEVKVIVDRINKFYRMLQIIYKPVSKTSGSYERNEELKANLELFVNEALSEFSFKKFNTN
ncbi:AbiV family abortive infection protein [uncultured Salegentibacter sp.]|uniref:AbiV family abortive infection protein n=1 Tax=uncultured Salegentibacter sp. TaxID=259320 RepID=UPI0025979BC5|nr:AbiV family abortive infection protein [uncultured Salegentibacter sp.]